MRNHRKIHPLLFISASLVLASCSLFPSVSASSASSKESASTSQRSTPSSEVPSVTSTEKETGQSSADPTSEKSEDTLPAISLPVGKFGDTEVRVHEYYPTVDYQVIVPYEGNDYPFPYPTLSNHEGEYRFVIDDSTTVFLGGGKENSTIRCQYHFGGYFHIKALDANDKEIASIYCQINTTQTGRGNLQVTRTDTGDKLAADATLTLGKGDSLTLKATYNGKEQKGLLSSSDPSILSVNGNVIKALEVGQASINVTYSAEDSTGTSYDYSFAIPVEVKRTDILESFYLSSGENGLYLINGEVRYDGEFMAVYKDKTEAKIPMNQLSFKNKGENEDKTEIEVSYSEGDIALSGTYFASSFTASKGKPTKMGFTFQDYFACLGTGISSMKLSGKAPFLVIPVWFTDSTSWFNEGQKTQMVEDIQERFFGDGSNGETVKTYYEKESRGMIAVEGVVAPFYEDSYAASRYNDYLNDGRTGELGARAVTDYFASHPEDSRTNYDLNGDGKLDTVIIMYAANYYGVYEDNRSDAFASHFYNSGVGANAELNNLVFAPIGGMYGFHGKTVSNVQKTASDLSAVKPNEYRNGSKTLIHEVGHLFGAEDLYFSGGAWRNAPSDNPYSPAGKFSMQDNNVGGHDPFTVNAYGWGQPIVYDASKYQVGDTVDVLLDDFQSSASSILLTNSWNEKNSPFDEYLNLELYSASGLNADDAKDALNPGIRLWHVDAELDLHNNGVPGAYPEQLGTDYIASNLYDTDEGFHLNHFIRNDENEGYRPTSTLQDSNLFHSGDSFSMEKFSKQFKNEGLLDDKTKLGWEFEPKAVFQNGDGTYGAVVRLTRVDNTITEFSSSAKLSNDLIGELTPEKDLAKDLGLDATNLAFVLHNNDGAAATVGWESPDHYLALNKGNSFDISLLEKEGYRCVIKSILLSFRMSTTYTKRGVPTLYVGGSKIDGTEHRTYSGKSADDPGYMSTTYEFPINALAATVKNEDPDSYVIWFTDITIEYSLIPNHLL